MSRLLKAAKKALENDKNVHFGRMVTGEQFITDEGRESIVERFAPLSVDMETAAIAQVCEAFGVPFIAVRSITDTAKHAGTENFEKNVKEAAKLSKIAVMRILERI